MPGLLFLIVAVFSVIIIAQNKKISYDSSIPAVSGSKNQEIILFYGDGCPHCVIVEEYVRNNSIEERVSFAKKEIYNNKQNLAELVEKASVCGMPTNSISVPFLWDGLKCYVGDQDIIEFFKQKINAQ